MTLKQQKTFSGLHGIGLCLAAPLWTGALVSMLWGCSSSDGNTSQGTTPQTEGGGGSQAQAGSAGNYSGTGGLGQGQGGSFGTPIGGVGGNAGTSGGQSGQGGQWMPTGGAGGMTSGDAKYPDSILCLPGNSDPRCGPGFQPGKAMGKEELQQVLSKGMDAWTYPGKNGGCVNCHAPDGIDLAKIGYSDCDIERRALAHVPAAQAQDLVKFIHGMRQIYQIEKPLHPDKFRPLQPGYEPLGEAQNDVDVVNTQSQDQRDELFMNYLIHDKKLLWASGKIDSINKAHQAYNELLQLDLENIRLGIPFDRFSEDPNIGSNNCYSYSGPAHQGKSIFEWVPAIPLAVKNEVASPWKSAVQKYVENPTTENLWGYYDAIDSSLECDADLSHDGDPTYYQLACDWMRMKYKSVQVLQHMLRTNTIHLPDTLVAERASNPNVFAGDFLSQVIHRSPIWETGDFMRVNPLERRGDPACFSSPSHPCTFLPASIDETIHSVPDYKEARINQGDLFQLSWFVMSFLKEPTLTQHSDLFATYIGDYLESALLPRYDIHHAFVFAVMAVRKSAAKEWFNFDGFRKGTGKIASVRTFSFKQIRNNFSHPPQSSPRFAAHQRMFANFARMFLYLVDEDIRNTNEVFGRDPRSAQEGGLLVAVRFMREWIQNLEGAEDPTINQLVKSIEALAPQAKELRDSANAQQYPGLEPTYVWGEYQNPY
jgi:hypothetical protein